MAEEIESDVEVRPANMIAGAVAEITKYHEQNEMPRTIKSKDWNF